MNTRHLLLVLPAVLFLCVAARAADAVYSGGLVQVAPGSIWIRLADGRVAGARLPKDGDLSAGLISSQYHLGDQVEITCKRIDPFLDSKTDDYFFLELKKLRLLRPPTPDEFAKVRATLTWKNGDNLLKIPPQAAEQTGQKRTESAALAHVREVNLGDALKMPNFIADERAQRFEKRKGSSNFQLRDTVESEITFQGSQATRQRVRINGKAWNSKSHWLPGITWGSAFGSEIKPLFDPECANTIEFKGPETVRGKQLLVYAFRAPADGCFAAGQISEFQYNGPLSGRVLVDDPGGRVIQFESAPSGFPPEFGLLESKQVLSWDYVPIGDSSFLLPVAGDYFITFTSGDAWHIAVEYKNHKHFETSIKLKVQ
jgi:hypothetical protein